MIQLKATKRRSVAKSLTWRIIATIITIITAFAFYGDVTTAMSLGISVNFYKMFGYYVHERIWENTRWGIK